MSAGNKCGKRFAKRIFLFRGLNAFLVSTVEFVFGLLLIARAVPPVACVMLSGVMVVAISTTAIRNIKATSPIDWLADYFYRP